jgi:hypothetical protein
MPMTTKERTELREELVSQGYSWNYIDEWQPKATLYRHREIKNPNGEVVSAAGTRVEGLPGNPDYVSRKARQGLLQWPPSDSCTCRWCMARKETQPEIAYSSDSIKAEEAPVAASGKGKKKTGPFQRE